MIIDVELTRRADGQYIARALQIPDVVVEATSRDGALQQMRSALMSRRAGTELVRIDIGDVGKAAAWPRHAGAFLDDEAYRRMLAEVERERLALDQAVAALSTYSIPIKGVHDIMRRRRSVADLPAWANRSAVCAT